LIEAVVRLLPTTISFPRPESLRALYTWL
jgi:hypothetical protein